MTWLISTSLRLRVIVLAAAILLVVEGVRVARETPLDVFPEFAPPRVEVQTEAPGLSSEEVEGLVTLPLENALNGTPGVRTIRSKSVLGLSSVTLWFAAGTDLAQARLLVEERLGGAASRLPTAAHAPVILQPLSSTSRALKIGLWSRTLDRMELSELARWTIRPRLMAVPGVANVAIWGQTDRQLQVRVHPDRLRAHDVSLDAVVAATRDATSVDSGGFIDTPNQRLAVRHVASVRDAEDLAAGPVAFRGGAALVLGDVADVVEGSPPPIGDAVINDGPGILLIVEKYPWGNTLDVTYGVEAALEMLRPGLEGVEIDATIFRPATFIEDALANLSRALLVGCGLVIVILIAFLFEWRAALISAVAIPVSLCAAGVVLHLVGATVNTMVLAGLVIAVGEVVDDAIIDVENISRRLRLQREQGSPHSAFRVVLAASLEVRSAVVFATMIVVLVFLPVLFLDGLTGAFFRPLAMSYVLAIVASLVVALTLTPALSLMLLSGARARDGDPPLVRVLRRVYRALLPAVTCRPKTVVASLVAAFALSGVAVTRLGEELLPDFQERDFLMHWVEKPGSSIEVMRRITERVSRELRSIPGVRNFGSHIGRAEVADEVVGPNFTELWISIDDDADYTATLARVQEVVDGYPGLYRDVLTYLKERVKEVLTGASATIVVRIFGPELETLRAKAHEVAAAIEGVPGVVDLKVEPQVLVPQIDVRLRAEAARRFGLTSGRVRRAATTLVRGAKVGEVFAGQRIHDVVVQGDESIRHDPEALRRMPIETPGGAVVPLGDVADVAVVGTPSSIQREGASRRIDVTCNVRDRDLGSVARDIEARVSEVPFGREYHPEVLGEYAERASARRRLFGLAALALLGILLILHADFRSLRLTALVCVTLPFALIGGVIAALLFGGALSLGSLVGFVTVLGIAARNGILLVSHYRNLEDEEGLPFGLGLVLRGAEERLAPILMTALSTALALLPLVVFGDVPGHEIEYPMALVIVGGLVTSTLLNLFLLPAIYLAFGKRRGRGDAESTARDTAA